MALSERVNRLRDGLMRRVWSALVILPVVLLALWAGGAVFSGFLALAGVIMSYEWVRLLASTQPRKDGFLLSCALIGLLLVAYLASPNDALRLLIVLMFILGGVFWFFCWRLTPVVGGMVYIGWPLLAVAFPEGSSGGLVILYIFLTVWAVDIFAMFAGKLFGGRTHGTAHFAQQNLGRTIGGCVWRKSCRGHFLLCRQCVGCVDFDLACYFTSGRRAGRCFANG